MPNNTNPHDRFDDVPRTHGRVGAHRAENPRMRAGLVLLWAAVAAIVLFLAGVFGSLVITGRISFGPEPTHSPTVSAIAPTIDPSYTVLVLNASPDESLTDSVKARVVQAGWSADLVLASDADDQNFPTTTVYYATEADKPAALGLADALGIAEVVQSDVYQQTTDAGGRQLTIVIGVDFAG